MKKVTFGFLIFFFSRCDHHSSNCNVTINTFLEKNSNKVFATKEINGNILELRDKGNDSTQGGYYSFYKNGYIKSYQFFVNNKTYTYSEIFDSLGNLLKQEGLPFVQSTVKSIKNDSLLFTLYFFSLNKIYKSIEVEADNGEVFNNLKLKNDTLYSNIEYAEFGLNVKGLKSITSYLNIKYKDQCSQNISSFKDTISLNYLK